MTFKSITSPLNLRVFRSLVSYCLNFFFFFCCDEMFWEASYGKGGLFRSLINITVHKSSEITAPKAWGIQLHCMQSQEAEWQVHTFYSVHFLYSYCLWSQSVNGIIHSRKVFSLQLLYSRKFNTGMSRNPGDSRVCQVENDH